MTRRRKTEPAPNGLAELSKAIEVVRDLRAAVADLRKQVHKNPEVSP